MFGNIHYKTNLFTTDTFLTMTLTLKIMKCIFARLILQLLFRAQVRKTFNRCNLMKKNKKTLLLRKCSPLCYCNEGPVNAALDGRYNVDINLTHKRPLKRRASLHLETMQVGILTHTVYVKCQQLIADPVALWCKASQ